MAETQQTQETTPNQDSAAATPSLEQQLKEALATAESYKAKYLTAVADMENLRKRHTREREEYSRYGTASVLEELLPFIDSYSLALNAARQHHPEAKAILDGFGMLLPQLMNTLGQQGLKELKPNAGDAFDPNLHQSVGEAPSDTVPHHAILNTARAGYQLHDRLLRPAMVLLSIGKTQ
jgi:molecular chaperone GrpE